MYSSFDQWFSEVNNQMLRLVGVGVLELPDRDWRSMYEDQVDPKTAAIEALEEEGLSSDDLGLFDA